MAKKTTVLLIMDGFGLSDETDGNAIRMAKTPNLDKIFATYPWEKGSASGLDVGLPEGQMGNSEVGHTNIGAGRVVYQELTRITKSITDGDFFENRALMAAVNNAKRNRKALHLMGLLSDGGVHSHNTHLYALLELAKRNGLSDVYVHAFLDGRDTAPTSGAGYLRELERKLAEIGVGAVATVMGRYYAMDRDKIWERVQLAYDALALGQGQRADSVTECIRASYALDVNDEFVVPTVILKDGQPTATIGEGDSVIFFNFRPDRAREITRVFCDPDFTEVRRAKGWFPLTYAGMTDYDPTIPNKLFAYHEENMANTMGEYISALGLRQLRLAETTKYAHVTFFFNGGVEPPNPGEDRVLVPTPEVATFDLQPEMSEPGVAEALVKAILSKEYDLIVINFANCDMVGHTGIIPAAVEAVEAVDRGVGLALDALLQVDGQMFICADHGNAEKMTDPVTKEPFTAHTTNPVPFALVNAGIKGIQKGGRLCDISPTLLDLMGLAQPEEMTGRSLVIR